MPDGEDDRIHLVVAQSGCDCSAGFSSEARAKSSSVQPKAPMIDFHGGALPGPGVADVDALALEVGEGSDASESARAITVNGSRMDGEDCAQSPAKAPLSANWEEPLQAVELPVGLGHAHVHVASP